MKKKRIQNLLNLAYTLIEEGKLSEALKFLNSLEPVDKYTEQQKTIFYTLISRIQIYLSNYKKAYETAEKGMQFANKIEKCIEVVDMFLNMAFILGVLGKNRESMNLLKESLEILKNLTKISEKDRKRRMGLINLYQGYNFHILGETMNSIEILKDAIDLLEKWGSQYDIAKAYTLLGMSYIAIGENNKALSFISKSQKICENKESLLFIPRKLQNNLAHGAIYWNKGDLQLALKYNKKVISLGQKYNKPLYTKMGLNNLGCNYGELGEWDQAIKSLKEALP